MVQRGYLYSLPGQPGTLSEALLTCLELECIDQVHSDHINANHNPPNLSGKDYQHQ